MVHKKRKTVLALVAFVLLVLILVLVKTRQPMRWAQTVKAEDVAKIEVVVHPPVNDKPYKNFDEEEFDAVIEKINQCTGRYTWNPEIPVGLSFCYYVTMQNGDVHTVACNGMELVIDEKFYTGDQDELGVWMDAVEHEVDSPVPEDAQFVY